MTTLFPQKQRQGQEMMLSPSLYQAKWENSIFKGFSICLNVKNNWYMILMSIDKNYKDKCKQLQKNFSLFK